MLTNKLVKLITLAVIAILPGLSMVSCSDSTSKQRGSSVKNVVKLQSVADWKRKAGYDYVPQSLQGTKSSLFNRVGRPYKEQKMGGSYYLYWQCSDGQIQLEVYGIQYEYGDIIGNGLNIY